MPLKEAGADFSKLDSYRVDVLCKHDEECVHLLNDVITDANAQIVAEQEVSQMGEAVEYTEHQY